MIFLSGTEGHFDENSEKVVEWYGDKKSSMTALMLDLADLYTNDMNIQTAQDSLYGKGATKFIGQAITFLLSFHPSGTTLNILIGNFSITLRSSVPEKSPLQPLCGKLCKVILSD